MNKDLKIVKFICAIVGILAMIVFIGALQTCDMGLMRMLTFFKISVIAWLLIIVSIVGWFQMQATEDVRKASYGSREKF